jgi:Uma2 family endonuclease
MSNEARRDFRLLQIVARRSKGSMPNSTLNGKINGCLYVRNCVLANVNAVTVNPTPLRQLFGVAIETEIWKIGAQDQPRWALSMSVSKRDEFQHTYADYLAWSRTYGDELIDGAAYVREPPSPSYSHQLIAFELACQLKNQLVDTPWRVCIAPLDVRLPKRGEPDDQVDTVVQPDVFITKDLRKMDARGLRGAPDWLAEVLSPSTRSYDRAVKIPVYERAGVSEVWLIEPKRLSVAIYRLANGRYEQPTVLRLRGRTPLTAVPEVTVDWDRITRELEVS